MLRKEPAETGATAPNPADCPEAARLEPAEAGAAGTADIEGRPEAAENPDEERGTELADGLVDARDGATNRSSSSFSSKTSETLLEEGVLTTTGVEDLRLIELRGVAPDLMESFKIARALIEADIFSKENL